MKIRFVIISVIFLVNTQLLGCPACVGAVEYNSPPFFADEFCQPQEQPFMYDSILTGSGF